MRDVATTGCRPHRCREDNVDQSLERVPLKPFLTSILNSKSQNSTNTAKLGGSSTFIFQSTVPIAK